MGTEGQKLAVYQVFRVFLGCYMAAKPLYLLVTTALAR
jgi:hypothetical protein